MGRATRIAVSMLVFERTRCLRWSQAIRARTKRASMGDHVEMRSIGISTRRWWYRLRYRNAHVYVWRL